MRVSALLPTHHLFEESIPWLVEARSVFDELVIFVDEERATPGTITRARDLATRVHCHKAETWFASNFTGMARACESEWVFLIEYDEQLSPEWQQQDRWRQILETSPFTHFWFPRRWIVPSGRYITGDPWFPDFQLRLLRNNIEGLSFATKLHELIRIPGAAGWFQNLSIHHHILSLLNRAQREDKVRYYEQLRPGGALGHLYLYEDYRPPEAPLPQPVKLNVNTELGWMDKLLPEDLLKLSFKVSGLPKAVHASEVFWFDVNVTNSSSENICSCPPFRVRLAYHWIDQPTRRIVIFEGERSELFPCVHPNATMSYSMKVVAPGQPGGYILQTTMLQENVRWFEEIQPDIVQEFAILVTA